MRLIIGVLAALTTSATSAFSADLSVLRPSRLVEPVRLECTPSRCLDTRTGAYTQSSCNRNGCYPIGGVVGYIDDDGERRGQRRGRSYDRNPGAYRGEWEGRGRGAYGNQWDCNRHRCIELSTGRLWESTCNRSGCSPLRPARRGY